MKAKPMLEPFLRNVGREVAGIERELARRLVLMGVRLDDASAIRAAVGNASRSGASAANDLSGLIWLLAKLARQSALAGHALPADSLGRIAMLGLAGGRG